MRTSREAAAATAEPVSEAETIAPINGPVRLSFDLYDNFLTCPRCGGWYLHHEGLTVFDRDEDEPRVTKIEVEDCSALISKVDSAGSGNPSERRHGVAVRFLCEDCDQTSEFLISQNKGRSFVGWRKC